MIGTTIHPQDKEGNPGGENSSHSLGRENSSANIMNGLLLSIILLIWIMSLPLSWQSEKEDITNQLVPRLEQDSEGRVKVSLFPSRTCTCCTIGYSQKACSNCDSLKRYWSVRLIEGEGSVDRLEVVEGLSVSSIGEVRLLTINPYPRQPQPLWET